MLSALALVADLQTTLTLGDRSEARARAAQSVPPGFDLATMPMARLDAADRRLSLSVAYTPMLTLPDLELGVQAQLFHTGLASMRWQSSRHSAVTISSAESYGDYNYTYLLPGQTVPGQVTPAPQLVPSSTTIQYGSTTSLADLRWSWRRSSAFLTPSYSASGGLDEISRAVLPLVNVADLKAGFDHHVTRLDRLGSRASVTVATSSSRPCDPTTGLPPSNSTSLVGTCAPREQWGEITEAWIHDLTRHAELTLSAGASLVNAELAPGGAYQVLLLPVASARLVEESSPEHAGEVHGAESSYPRGGSGVDVLARLSPFMDTRYGIIDPRVEASVGVFHAFGDTTLSSKVWLLRSFPPTVIKATYVSASVEAMQRLGRRFDAGGGFRAAWQQDWTGETIFGLVYASLVWHEPRIRL